MKPTDDREEVIFRKAQQKAPGLEREAFLDGACGEDELLRKSLEARLQQSRDSFPEPASTLVELDTVVVPPTEGPGTVIGRYKILEKVGEGGFGVVYVAEQREPVKRRVAIKIIKLGMDTRQVVARFEAERQALALMDHPNIAKVLDAGATGGGRPYFVMELVKGVPITQYCDQEKQGTRERLHLFIQVCHAIQHAHQKGIIHRDIKPSNILVTLHDGVAVPKVIDFGIAKATQAELTEKTVYTQLQQFIGTPAYMSPEQAEMSGLDIDTRSDIYSLGVLLYELLTGSTPFDTKELLRAGLDEMRRIVREREPVRPSTRLRETKSLRVPQTQASILSTALSTDLDWIVMKCLEKDRRRRYETANGVAMDVERHLRHEPVLARPPSVAYRMQKSFSRNRLMFIAACAVGMALVLGAVVSTWQAVVATNARQNEVAARGRADKAAQAADAQKQRAEEEAEKAKASEIAARRQAYASDMNLVQQALAANNLGRARELLYRQCPGVNEPDLRGWEWRYLWQFCQSDALLQLCQKSNSIHSLSVSPDGEWLAIGEAEQGNLSIWDLRTRQEAKRLPAGDGAVRAVFSPRQPLLAFSSGTGFGTTNSQFAVHLWNASSASEAQIPLDNSCLDLAFSGDGQTLVVLSQAGTQAQISLWRVRDQQRIASYPVSLTPQGQGHALAVTPDLTLAAVGYSTVQLLDLSTGKERWSIHADKDRFSSLGFSPDAKALIGTQGTIGTSICFWDAVSGKEIIPARGEHAAWVSQLLVSADGRTLVTASADQTIRLWDVSDFSHLSPRGRPLRGHRQEVWSLAMLPDQRTLVSGSKDGSVLLWDIAAPRNPHALATLPVKVNNWSFGVDSKSVAVLDNESHVAMWQGEDFRDKRILFDVPAIGSEMSCFSSNGRLLSLGSTNGVIRVWDLEGRAPPREFTANTRQGFPVRFLPKANNLVIYHEDDQSLRVLDLATGKETSRWEVSMLGDWPELAVSPDERWCIHFGWGGASSLIEMATGHVHNLKFNLKEVSSAVFSPDGKLLAAASWKGLVRLWETTSWREVRSLRGVLLGCHSVAFSPDGTRLAMGSNGQEAVKLWDTSTYQDLLTLPGSGSVFLSTAFSPDGNVLGSMTASGLLHLWRAPSWAEIDAAEKTREAKAQ